MGQNVFKKRAAFATSEGNLFRSCASRCKSLSRKKGLPFRLEYSANSQYSILQAFEELDENSKVRKDAFSLTVDVGILNDKGELVLALEYDGKGHDSKNDNIKKEVLDKIGVPVIRISDREKIKEAVKAAFRHIDGSSLK